MENYDYQQIEKKWAKKWVEDKIFTPDLTKAKNPYYALFMFPYPSAEGLHVGNFYCFTCIDVMAKYKKLQGFDVFEPIGFDAFGMHSENYALKIGETPRKMLKRTMANFRQQLISAGLGCDWTREVDTTTPEYYKWTQWIFVKLFEKGLAYQKEALLNWCPGCKTVLADEQIEGGVCERCKTIPEKRMMRQWFFKITAYAQKLLDELDSMDWSDITKAAQKNWIGRSEGATVKFSVIPVSESGSRGNKDNNEILKQVQDDNATLEVFTTRPDTLFGATYFVLAPEHPLVEKITTKEQREAVEQYIKESGKKSDLARTEAKEKTGVFTGAYVINPVNQAKIPVWIADYVLMGYGTGAIMAVPAHDERDWEFAKKYNLKIIEVVKGSSDIENEVFTGNGENVNSEFLNGLTTDGAKKKIINWLEERDLGKRMVNYRLRDWCISRQRYWGPPVPVIYCDQCGTVAVPEDQLPVILPDLEKGWEPAGDGRGPLAKVESFMKTKCPKCGGEATREPDVMDNFLDSAWYFFRYLSPQNDQEIFDTELGKKWLPIDLYVGGNEHAVLHLMYTRFITMALHDLDLINFANPFKRFRANGMILKDGKKMSKSKGNVVSPEEYGVKVGYDALKTYLLFLGPLSEDRSFTDSGVQGCKRFVEKIYRLEEKVKKDYTDSEAVIRKLHQTINVVAKDFTDQKYNTSVARLMELTNLFISEKNISITTWKKFLVIVAPFTPALAEELWERSGRKQSIFAQKNWPEYDPELARDEKIELAIQINGKLRDTIKVAVDIDEAEAKKVVMESEKIKKWLEGKEIVKVIFVKGRLVNVVSK
jgi:leucyl-tRNA synthetase